MTHEPKRVTSTGEVETPTEPVTTEHAMGRSESTGEVEFDTEPVTTRTEHLGQPATGEVETPGPVEQSVDWLSKAESKVVKPPTSSSPTGKTGAETKSATGDTTSER